MKASVNPRANLKDNPKDKPLTHQLHFPVQLPRQPSEMTKAELYRAQRYMNRLCKACYATHNKPTSRKDEHQAALQNVKAITRELRRRKGRS